ncbi:MAG: O-antigen ligase family protein [Pseudomonadota bacterium]
MISIAFFYLSQLSAYIFSATRTPAFAFVGYEIVYFFYDRTRWWFYSIPDLPYSFGMSLLVLVLAFADKKRTTPTTFLSIGMFRWMWLVVLLHGLTYFWSQLPTVHLDAFDNYLKMAIIVTAAFKLCATREALNYYLYAYVFGTAYLGYYLLEVGRNSGARVSNFGLVDSPDVNGVAATFAPAAIFALHFFWRNKGWQKWIMVLAGAFIVNAIVLMNSRGTFLGLFIGASYYVYRLYNLSGNFKASRGQIVGMVFAGLLAMLYVLDESAIERIVGITDNIELSEEQESGSTRIYFWLAAVEMSADYPQGLGTAGFQYNAPDYIPRHVNTGTHRNRAVHSSWFQTLIEIGYLGFFLFSMMLLSAALMLRKTHRECEAKNDSDGVLTALVIQSALVAYLVSATFIDRMRAEVLYWLLAYAACAYNVYLVRVKSLLVESNPAQTTSTGELHAGQALD